MSKINIICLPFAGGNKYAYRLFQKWVSHEFNLFTVEYPGRGLRTPANSDSDINMVTMDAYHQISHLIEDNDYVIYGHSMGALIGFELIHHIIANNKKPPLHFFVTGTIAPSSILRKTQNRHLLNKEEFIAMLRELDGCPEELFQDEELFDFFEQIIRSDFKLIDSYVYKRRMKLQTGITVVVGANEKLSDSEVRLWQDETTFEIDFLKMDGKHFFIFDHSDELIKLIENRMLYQN